MRNKAPLMIAAALLVAGPAAAQDNAAVDATTNAPAAATDPAAVPDANLMMNGMTADPMAAPVATDPAAIDPALAVPVEDNDGGGGFPWGVLGLLGLLGLIPRRASR